MPPAGPAHPQCGAFAALGRAQHDPGIGRQHRRQHGTGHPEKHEHPFADRCIVARHRQRVRDIVEQEILPACHRCHRPGDLFGLRQRHAGFGIQQGALHPDIHLAHRRAFDPRAAGSRRPFKGRNDLGGKAVRADDDRKRHVKKGLKVRAAPAGEQRARLCQIDNAADARLQPAAIRQGQRNTVADAHRQRSCGLGADHCIARHLRAGDDVQGLVLRDIAGIKAEHPGRAVYRHCCRNCPGGKIGKRQLFRKGHTLQCPDPGRQIVEPDRFLRIGRDGKHRFAGGKGGGKVGLGDGAGGGDLYLIGKYYTGAGGQGADVQPGLGQPLVKRIVRPGIDDLPVRRRRSGQIVQPRTRHRADHHFVGRGGALIDHLHRNRDGVARIDRHGRLQREAQPQIARHRLGQHPLHIDRQRCHRALRHRRRQAVDKEQHGAKQPDAQQHPYGGR